MDPTRWAAIVARDKAFDGAFVYCVKSTKIYCRPTCAARLARRANVHFCDTAADAEAAGFRPCKRCKPELFSHTPQDDKVQQACSTICRFSLGPDNPRLEDLAREVGLTKHHFHRLFKKKTGLTPRQYAEALRASDSETMTSSPSSLATSTGSNPHAVQVPASNSPSAAVIHDDTFIDPNLLWLAEKSTNQYPLGSVSSNPLTWEWFDMEFTAGTDAEMALLEPV
ncbi:hypothetical protein C1H76_5310 [Elsinoe australis]|uniref:HTH araC/xylS-type domain-containing protein n=1 Tax=Elsinoe australis TaxID=40998 RepID=A0A4U7B558_9PEZI|nr:hypothetical protein C1H76_5310 [Elsinoe australis]